MLDFLFLLAYASTIALACIWVGERGRALGWRLSGAGTILAWAQTAAALLDGVENTALLRLLLGPVQAPWPQLAWLCAVPKFLLVSLGLLYVIYGLIRSRRPAAGRQP